MKPLLYMMCFLALMQSCDAANDARRARSYAFSADLEATRLRSEVSSLESKVASLRSRLDSAESDIRYRCNCD